MNYSLDRNIIFFLSALLLLFFLAIAAYTGVWILSAIPFLVLFFVAGWNNRSIIFYLLLLSIPFSIEYQISSTLGTDLPDELLMFIVSFLFLAAWVYSPGILPAKTLRHPLLFLLLISFTWICCSTFFSSDPPVSWKFLLAKGWYAGAFVLAPLTLFTNKQTIARSALFLVLAMLLVVLIVLYRHSSTSFSFATVNDALYPFFRNHVNYSAMLVCLVPVVGAIYYLSPERKWRFLSGLLLILFLVALFFSYSRGAWLALFVGILAVWLIKKRLLLVTYLLAMIIAVVALFWVKKEDRYLEYAPQYDQTIFHPNFSEHLIATYHLKDVSTAERFYRWIAGTRMIKDNWVTGYGPNTFYENYKPYAVPAYKTWVSNNTDHSTVHNYFLLTAIEQGIPGLIFLLLLIGGMIYYAQSIFHKAKNVFYKVVALCTGVIITMLIILNCLSDLVETDKVGSIFFLCISVLVASNRNLPTGQAGAVLLSDPSPDIQRIP